MTPDSTNIKSLMAKAFILLTLFYVGEAIPPILRRGGDKFVLHPKNTKSLKKKCWKFA